MTLNLCRPLLASSHIGFRPAPSLFGMEHNPGIRVLPAVKHTASPREGLIMWVRQEVGTYG